VIDTHCHLDSCKPTDAELIAGARQAGITRLATVGMDGPTIERALEAARAYPEVSAIVGWHPHNTEGFGADDLETIERAAAAPEVVAIGETGLDYFRDHAPREGQRRAFEAQLDLAARLGLPVAIHTRAAEDDTFAILRERAGAIPAVILHCFSAPDRLDEVVERGYLCSFAGNVTYPKATELQDAARDLPADRVLVETDSPYLAPVPHRGRPCRPAMVLDTLRFLAELRGEEPDALGRGVIDSAAVAFAAPA
jgi:TatD DNase family protein